MDIQRFETIARALTTFPSRRHVLHGLGGLGLTLGAAWLPDDVDAKKKKKGKKGKGRGKGKKKDRKPTPPPPPPPASPPPPPGCQPACAGKPCGADDGCGGICGCAAGSICHEGDCRACTVTCDGNGPACGTDLQKALIGGGTVYACPGRYVGNFEVNTTGLALIGAGAGDDPATSTILDANQSGRALLVKFGAKGDLHRLRVTGGNLPVGKVGGAGIRNEGTLTMSSCTVSKNTADLSAGIHHHAGSNLILTNCIVENNTATGDAEAVGGGLNCTAGAVTVNGGAFTGNKAFGGGGICNIGCTIAIQGCDITKNEATNAGGGLLNRDKVTLDSASRITGNLASSGGGIWSFGGTVNLNGATVTGNSQDNCAPAGSVDGCTG